MNAKNFKTGETRTLMLPGDVKLELVYCAPGKFLMGHVGPDRFSFIDQHRHEVALSKGFWIGKFQITQAQWKSVTGVNPAYFKGPDNPVETVSWEECRRFCQRSGFDLRLPTEAEWEYACRAGSTEDYAGELDAMAWHGDNSEWHTHPVGTKAPNAWGIYDMSGNVFEWCWDCFGDYPQNRKKPVVDPKGPNDQGSQDGRIQRGGSWKSNPSGDGCKCWGRLWGNPVERNSRVGFRIAMDENAPTEPKPVPAFECGEESGAVKTIVLPGGAELEMIFCAPGEFIMGVQPSEYDYQQPSDHDRPHPVKLTKGFWLGKYQLTQKQWKSVMADNPSEFQGDRRPVENVSYNDCRKFLAKAGLGLRLPTEAEWEYACRAGATDRYAGTGDLDDMGWYEKNSRKQTHPVGGKRPNAWGFHDMHGNVDEICGDLGCRDYGRAPAVDPKGAGEGNCCCVRGGSWNDADVGCRSGARCARELDERTSRLGFRVAMDGD